MKLEKTLKNSTNLIYLAKARFGRRMIHVFAVYYLHFPRFPIHYSNLHSPSEIHVNNTSPTRCQILTTFFNGVHVLRHLSNQHFTVSSWCEI